MTVEKHPDGSQTVTTTTKDGTSTKVDVDAKGNVTAVDATVSKDAAKDGSGYFDCSDQEIAEMLMPFFRDMHL